MDLRGGDVSFSDSDGSENQVRYLNELMLELRALYQQMNHNNSSFFHATKLVMSEMDRVWNGIYSVHLDSPESSPPRARQAAGRSIEAMSVERRPQQASFRRSETSSVLRQMDQGYVVLQEKVLMPTEPHDGKCNFIGRIIGPSGMSIKQLEAETDCSILIRGKGSVKDPRKEYRLRSQRGWEHLREPLHVLITATDTNRALCEYKLRMAVQTVKMLLTPDHDEYKRKQLIQLAIINGTYRQQQE